MTDALTGLKAVSANAAAALGRRVAFIAAVGVMALTAFAFGLAAAWTALADHFGSLNASMFIAGGLTVAALLSLAIDAHLRRRRRKRQLRRALATRPDMAPLLLQTFVAALHTGRSVGASKS